MVHLMRTVLSRAMKRWSRSWSEAQLERVLHLVALALYEEQAAHRRNDGSFNFIEKATQGNN